MLDQDYPFTTTRQNQFSLGSILATRFASYPHSSPFAPNYPLGSDFIFYPLHSLFHSDDAGFCSYPGTRAVLIESVTNEIRALANELAEMAKVAGLDAYPRLVIPIATVRRFSNYKLLTQVIAEELKDKIVLLGIETDPLIYEDPLKYVVQVPYPTIYHFGKDDTQDWRRTSSDYFLDKPRPNLFVPPIILVEVGLTLLQDTLRWFILPFLAARHPQRDPRFCPPSRPCHHALLSSLPLPQRVHHFRRLWLPHLASQYRRRPHQHGKVGLLARACRRHAHASGVLRRVDKRSPSRRLSPELLPPALPERPGDGSSSLDCLHR